MTRQSVIPIWPAEQSPGKQKSALREQGGLRFLVTGRRQTYFSGAGAGALSAGGGGASVALREMGDGEELITRDGEDVTPQPPLPQPPLTMEPEEQPPVAQPELQLAGAELQQVAAGAQQVRTGALQVRTGAQLL